MTIKSQCVKKVTHELKETVNSYERWINSLATQKNLSSSNLQNLFNTLSTMQMAAIGIDSQLLHQCINKVMLIFQMLELYRKGDECTADAVIKNTLKESLEVSKIKDYDRKKRLKLERKLRKKIKSTKRRLKDKAEKFLTEQEAAAILEQLKNEDN